MFLGIAVGDALGVPVEFLSRKDLVADPVVSMRGYGTHDQPEGTWSDDSSLTFCLAENLCNGYNLNDLANRFINWYEHAYWTAHGKVFDVGITTSNAIWALRNGTQPVLAGADSEGSNGNGSLMRILPLIFHLRGKDLAERFAITKEVSSLTHRHIRSAIGCFIYLEYALELLDGNNKFQALASAKNRIKEFLDGSGHCTQEELFRYHRILTPADSLFQIKAIQEYTEAEIASFGYVVHTLEASIWCFLNTENYKDAVLKAVNLGLDTDTSAAVTGGLAGLYYFTRSVLKIIEANEHRWDRVPPVELSTNEKDFLKVLTGGKINTQIAEDFKMTVGGMEKFRVRLFKKVGVPNAPALVAYAFRNGIL